MKKKFICILFLIVLTLNMQAQNTIAKLKYEQAEEAYNTKDYALSLEKLKETEKLLGQSNPKILYLKIKVQDKLMAEDKQYLASLKKDCAFYLKNYENIENIEEKYKEVYLIYDALSQFETNETFEKALKLYDEKKYAEALPYLKEAIKQGYVRAYTLLGHFYRDGLSVPVGEIEAVKNYRISAERGNAEGQYWMGWSYYHGKGVTQNYKMALEWFEKSAEKGNLNAKIGVADTYYYGFKDYEKALIYYLEASKLEDSYVWFSIGYQYYQGEGVAKDYSKAFYWFEKAANKELPSAMYYLGVIYENGYGIEKNNEKAVYWYTKAAQAGHYYAMGDLANLLETGEGIKKDKKAAKEWREKQKTIKKD